MKKIFTVGIAIGCLLSLCACQATTSQQVQQGGLAEPWTPEDERGHREGLRGLQGDAARRGMI
mgnify:CR=1 FL=1